LGLTFALLGSGSIEAEEQTPSSGFQNESRIDSYLSAFHSSVSFSVSLSANHNGLAPHEFFHLLSGGHFVSLLSKISTDDDLESDSSVTLFRKPRHSRFAYPSWTGLRTGYGQYFSTATFARSRTNGVGTNEPDFLYLKMSFRF